MGCGKSRQIKEDVEEFQRAKTLSTNRLSDQSATQTNSIEEGKISAANFVARRTGNVHQDYCLGKKIGQGPYGTVRFAKWRKTNEPRSVKSIQKSFLATSLGDINKFDSEISTLRSFDHPNILKLYECIEDEEAIHLISEVCTGGHLFDQIIAKRRFDEPLAARFMTQVLSSLTYCHRNGIVHGDLKPENLLLESDRSSSVIKVTNFGTSCLINPVEARRNSPSPAYYTAPEVLNGTGNCVDEKSDVWSCGVILYVMLCGFVPFIGTSDAEIWEMVRQGRVSFGHKYWKKISDEAQHLIRQMLRRNPEDRITAAEAYIHPWLKISSLGVTSDEIAAIYKQTLANLRSYKTEKKLQTAVLSFIATQVVSHKDTTTLKDTFLALDANGDGQLSRQELIDGFSEVFADTGEVETIVDELLAQVDTDKSGFIDYSEFIAAAMNRNKLLSRKNMQIAFEAFDKDNSGSISIDELKESLGASADSDQVWQQIVNEIDIDKNGEVDLHEFTEMMLKLF